MKRIVFILSVLILTFESVYAQKQKKAIRFLRKAEKTIKHTKTVSYDAVYRYKSPADTDTLLYRALLKYSENPRDFFFGYDLWYSDDKYYDAYYSLGKSYNLDTKAKKIYPYRFLDPAKTDLKAGPFKGNTQDGVFACFLKDKDFFSKIINDNSYRITMISRGFCSDTVVIEAEYIVQNTDLLPDTIRDFSYIFYFLRKNKFPVKIISHGVSSKGVYFSCLKLSKIKLNDDPVSDFFLSYNLPADYMMVKSAVEKKHNDTVKVRKIKAPDFTALDIDGKEVKLSDFHGKVVLLDFWYSSCHPCIKASKYINGFSKKYADSGLVVLGMDPFDGQEKIKQHNRKWKIDYQGLKCDDKTKNDYDVSSFPSFILIDKNGMIVYRASGFSMSIINRIEQEIRMAIRQ